MPTVQNTFIPLQWKNGINPKSHGSFQTFMKQLADWANNIQNQITAVSSTSSFVGYAFYSGSAPSVSTSPAPITNWVAGTHGGLGVTLALGTTFTVSGISVVSFQATTPADNLAYSALLSSTSGTGMGAGSGGGRGTGLSQYLSFSGAQSQGSFTVQTFASSTGSLSACALSIFMLNL